MVKRKQLFQGFFIFFVTFFLFFVIESTVSVNMYADTPTPTIPNAAPISTIPNVTLTPIPTTALPAITPGVGHTIFSLSVCPHGLGNCGDNVNPNGGNTTPQHLQKPITITVLNSANQIVSTQQGTISYNAASGNFTGTIDMGALPSGNYLIKEKTLWYLSTQIPGIAQIVTSLNNTVPLVTAVTGDINNDNQLDIIDYNAILNCYGSKQNTAACQNPPNAQTIGADLNDDGFVNGTDYNLLLRELSVQKGQ